MRNRQSHLFNSCFSDGEFKLLKYGEISKKCQNLMIIPGFSLQFFQWESLLPPLVDDPDEKSWGPTDSIEQRTRTKIKAVP